MTEHDLNKPGEIPSELNQAASKIEPTASNSGSSPTDGIVGPPFSQQFTQITTDLVQIGIGVGPHDALPSPEYLRACAEVDPALPGRLMTLAEEEQKHRQAVDFRVLDLQGEDMRLDHDRKRRGQTLGFVIAIAFLVGAVILAWLNQPWVAGIALTGPLLGLVAIFVIGRVVSQQRSRTASDSGVNDPESNDTGPESSHM